MRVPEDMIRLLDGGMKRSSSDLGIGCAVEGNYKGKGKWYSGVIRKIRSDGSYDIDYDDGEVESAVRADWVREKAIGKGFSPSRSSDIPDPNSMSLVVYSKPSILIQEGARVEANYKGKGNFFPGTVKRDRGNGTFDIAYDDGEQELRVPEDLVRLLNQAESFDVGTEVEVDYRGQGKYYPSRIKRNRGNDTFDIDFDDGEQELRVPTDRIRLRGRGSVKSTSPAKSSIAASKISEGAVVEVDFKGRGKFYPGRVKKDRGDGTYNIDYNDGEQELRVPEERIRVKDVAKAVTITSPSFRPSASASSLGVGGRRSISQRSFEID